MKLFAIKFSLGIFVFYLEYFNNIANTTRESRTSLQPIYAIRCKTNNYIPYAVNVENDYIIYILYNNI